MPPRAWFILLLCGFAGMLFYVDRQTLSVLKTTLKLALGWSDIDYGWIVTAFMACYVVGYLFAGRWVDRWGTRRTMPLFIALMSAATIGCGLSSRLGEIAGFRALLGFAQAGIVPAVVVAIFTWFPPTRRATASAVSEPINIGGQIIATPLAVAFAQGWGWRFAFFAPGAIGLAIAFLWWRTEAAAAPAIPPAPSRAAETARILPRHPSAPGNLGRDRGPHDAESDPIWFFLLYWEPGFLQARRLLPRGAGPGRLDPDRRVATRRCSRWDRFPTG